MIENLEKPIVIINGTGGSGKDTFVEFVSQYESVYNFSSIDLVKEIASLEAITKQEGREWLKEYGWKGKKTEKDRKFLSQLKKVWKEYNELPFLDTKKAIEDFQVSDKKIMFIHIREPEEIKQVVNAVGLGVSTLLIKRRGLDNITSNSSDALVDNYPYDFIIENNSLEELEFQAKQFIENIQNYTKKRIKKLD